jgi:predicted peptidase
LRVAKDLILDFIQNHSIDPARVYCIGQSMGGFATWALLSEFPGIFAAAAPLAGGGRPGKGSIIAQTPVWAFHGDKDNIVRVWRSRQMVKAIQRKGGDIRYTEIENGTHYIWPRVCSEPGLIDWLTSHQLQTEPGELLMNS